MADSLYHVDKRSTVLCPQLYGKLRELSKGDVIVTNEGEAFLSSNCLNPATGRHETWVSHAGEYYAVNCPFCKDTRHRLWVNHMYGQPDASGLAMRFLATCYNEHCLSKAEHRMAFNDFLFGFRNANERRNVSPFVVLQGTFEEPGLRLAPPPGELLPVSSLPAGHKAVQYMVGERRYTAEMLNRYQISYCVHAAPTYREAYDRIVFPVMMEGQCVGWQCRYIGTTDWRITPKYYGMPGMKKRLMLYNFDLARNYPFVVVVEGPTDVHSVGDPAVAMLGKTLSRTQKQLLFNNWPMKPIIFMLDPDARADAAEIIQEMVMVGTNPIVEVALPGDADPGSYSREAIWNIIYSQCAARGVNLG